ncbi:MAG TPA: phage portal protein, partial [Burkholderiales bacterium]
KPEQREEIRKNLVRFTGSANMGKVMVLENGMTYEPITMSAKDSQMLETRAWNVEEICRWLDTPPPLIGHTNKASSWASSLENTILWYIKTTVRPTVVAIEQALKRALKLPASTVIEFNMDDLERGDSAARAALYASAAQNGWMDRDEIRDLENLPRRGNGAAQLTVQSNLVPLDKLEELGGKPGNSDKPQPGDSTGGDPGETT